MAGNNEIIRAFVEESAEALELAERALVQLEAKPEDAELLRQVYRSMHTVKGTCGFLGFAQLEAVAHAAEDMLDQLRSGEIALDATATSVLLETLDRIRQVVAVIDETGADSPEDHAQLIAKIADVTAGRAVEGSAPEPAPEASA